MKTQLNKKTLATYKSTANGLPKSQPSKATSKFQDNRPVAAAQQKLQNAAAHYIENQTPVQLKKNETGLPDQLKTGIENLSGLAMDDVKVHYNSAKPTQLQAHAYAQGTAIHLASGQEKHLPHEAWHVVQQKQGRVKPTMQLKGKVNVNNDVALEREADVMGAKSLNQVATAKQLVKDLPIKNHIIQGQFIGIDPANEQHLVAYNHSRSALDNDSKKLVFDKLFNDPVIAIHMADAVERAKHINFTKQLDPTNVNAKPKLTEENITALSSIRDLNQFIGLYAILTGQDNLNWTKAYDEADAELKLHLSALAADQQQLALEQQSSEAPTEEMRAEGEEITRVGEQLRGIGIELGQYQAKALESTRTLFHNFSDLELLNKTNVDEQSIREETTHIHAIIIRLRGIESRSHSAKARAHAVDGVSADHKADSQIYADIVVSGRQTPKNFEPVDTNLKPPAAKSVINLGDRNVKISQIGSLNEADLALKKAEIVAAVNHLSPAVSKRQIYYGPSRYADRGPGQANSMAGVNAATYAWALGLPNALTTDWEWLHIQGAGLGGETNSTNLLPGLYDANTLMIPFESNIKILARYATNFMPLTVNFNVLNPRGGQHAAQTIQIAWQFNHANLVQDGNAQFDILNGRVVTKGDIDVIEEFLKEERGKLIDEKATKSVKKARSSIHDTSVSSASFADEVLLLAANEKEGQDPHDVDIAIKKRKSKEEIN